MKIIELSKREALLYLAVAIAGTILLGIGLSKMEFQGGLPIPGAEIGQSTAPLAQNSPQVHSTLFSWIFRGVLGIIVAGLIYLLVASLVKSKGMLRIGLICAALVIFIAVLGWLPISIPQSSTPAGADVPDLVVSAPGFDLAPIGEPPAALFRWVTIGLIAVGTSVFTWWILRGMRNTQRNSALANVVESAIQSIQGGERLANVIIRCYAEMERVVRQEQGIEREGSVTPREFEVYLTESGVPASPVLRLTRLFERARYGNEPLTRPDETDALESLEEIGEACRKRKAGIA